MALADLGRRVAKLAIDYSPQLLTSVGVVGTLATAYLTGRASWQAADMIRLVEADAEMRGEVVPPPKEIIRRRVDLVWKLYIPPLIVGAATVASVVTADRVNASRIAGVITTAGIIERQYSDHKAKIIEKFGERKAEQVHDEIAQDRVNQSSTEAALDILAIGKGEICYDTFGGQYFTSTVEDLRSAQNSLNASLLHCGTATLADFYRLLDIDVPTFSENVGWNSNRPMRLNFSSTLFHETKPCISFRFQDDPMPDYSRFH